MDRQWFRFMKKTLEFLVVVSFSCFFCSYFPGFPFSDLQFTTLIFSLFGHALDRKYMFLVCNGILAFLAKNLNMGSSSFNYGGVIKKDHDDGVKQFIELPAVLEEEIVEENVEYAVSSSDDMTVAIEEAQVEETKQKQGGDDHGDVNKEVKMVEIVLDGEVDDEDEDEEEEDGLFQGNKASEVNDASVSTEELNQKFEEFIRKMKEEIRIEAQQQLIAV